MSVCKKACEILSKTRDGDDLSPEHLKLLELAVNGYLNDTGNALFEKLHRDVSEGNYRKPWLHDVEHLTRDHEGYVYWKGHEVEHWSGDLPYSEEGREQALELARRCRIIEARGEVPSAAKVVWCWRDVA